MSTGELAMHLFGMVGLLGALAAWLAACASAGRPEVEPEPELPQSTARGACLGCPYWHVTATDGQGCVSDTCPEMGGDYY